MNVMKNQEDFVKIAVVGMGYVGIPVAEWSATQKNQGGDDMKVERKISLVQGSFPVVLVMLALLFMASCASLPKDYAALPESIPRQQATAPSQYQIQIGDLLQVRYPYTESHTEELMVMPDGNIAAQVAGKVKAVGLTAEDLAEEIRKASSVRLRDPKVIVSVKQSSLKVYVGGEVTQAGPVPYREGLTALQAIFEKGGFKDTANWDDIVLVRLETGKFKTSHMGIEEVASHSLQASDVIYVPKTGVAKVNLAVKQFIRDMLPIAASWQVGNL
jgi:protein involved in polysaccharide export with SLBB domain